MKALLVLFAVAMASTANAQNRPPPVTEKPLTPVEAKFRALDINNDRKLSRSEAAEDIDASSATDPFGAMDRDGDGFLSMAEYLAAHAQDPADEDEDSDQDDSPDDSL